MSALDGWVDVCRTGTWRDSRNRDVEVTEAMLDGYVAAHATQDPVPVVVGHPAQDAPAYGFVASLRRTGDRLQARFRDFMPEFRAAVEAGRFTGRSIAVAGGQLRHVGFLGGRPPAVPGLAPTQFSAAPETVLAFASGPDYALGDAWSPRTALRAIALTVVQMARGWREGIIAEKDIETADSMMPSWRIDDLQHLADNLDDSDSADYSSTEENPVSGPTPSSQPTDEATLAARKAELDAREARIAAAESANAQTARLAAAATALEPHVAAGRVLPAERASLEALFASLPEGDAADIAFAAPDGSGEQHMQPRAIFERFLGALAPRIDYTELAGGPVPAVPAAPRAGEDSAGIAAEARVLMSEAAERGQTLTAIQAVDQVRARRGLPTGGAA